MSFSNSTFVCSAYGGFAAVSDLWWVMDNLNYTNPLNKTGKTQMFGGLFFM